MKKIIKFMLGIFCLCIVFGKVQAEEAYDTKLIRSYTDPRVSSKSYPKEEKRLCFLTFDDGPSKNTLKVLDILKKDNVKGTFYVVGRSVSKSTAPILKRTLSEGHSIGIHTFSHDYKYLYPNRIADPNQILYEYDLTLESLRKYLGKNFDSKTFRYPGGHMSWKKMEKADELLKSRGVEWMDWNASVGDASPKSRRPKTKNEMLSYLDKTINANKNNNCIVILMHDARGKDLTVETLPDIIKHLKKYQYEFGVLK